MSYSPATKEVLIDQLRAVFVARGYDGATLANLASAVSLSKASLYHHFPGGKPEMASALVRHAIADLQRHAFSHLGGPEPAQERLIRFIDGFSEYTQAGSSDCLLAVFNHHSTASEETAQHQRTIAEQFDDWHAVLAEVFEATGLKSKKATQQAYDLLGALYGALLVARMHNEPRLFARAVKRLKKRLKKDLNHPLETN
jgi:AcrR family transcriptional regulator